ncbi:MAG TPA: zf-HC2 domain-containing protein, partial [Gemmataceae bacterium]|nr:zf-HC2 domain-containing protein [Gemmataceae bacterium]
MNDSSLCPDAHTLEAFLQGQAPPKEAVRVNEHVKSCAECRRALAALALRGVETTDGGKPRGSEEPTLPPAPPTAVGASASSAGAAPQEFPFLAPPQADDEIGRLGAYRVLRVLGSGGMGVVFEAEDPKLQRHVALKVMRAAGSRQGVFRERFLREARAAARLEHDHVVPVYQVDEDRGVL